MIELEENIKRESLDWQDECRAIVEYHRLKKAQEQNWSQEDTAKALGKTQVEISHKLGVAAELQAGNERILQADKYSVARNLVARSNERQGNAELERIFSPETADALEDASPIINADFTAWFQQYSGPRFNFIHCDFPYGINADTHNQGASKAFGGYEDTPEIYQHLLEALAAAMENVVAKQAHLVFWFPIDKYQQTFDALTAMGWKVDPVPLIWHKADNTGILPDPTRHARRIYETAFMAARGDQKIVSAVGNVIASPVTKSIHMSEKPKVVLRHFFRMFVDETTRMLDPTCGSGNAISIAENMGAKAVLGLEIDREFCERAQVEYVRTSMPIRL